MVLKKEKKKRIKMSTQYNTQRIDFQLVRTQHGC